MLLNEHKHRGYNVVYYVFECDEHTGHLPKYGCRIYVNNDLNGSSQGHPNKKTAREAAAQQVVYSLILS